MNSVSVLTLRTFLFEISGQIFIKEIVAAALEDAVLKLWDLNKAVIIQTLSLHFPAFSVLGKEVRTLL
jgi:hypothetical protein